MSEGELLQIQKSRKLDITEDIYFEIIRKKTAALIAACTASGAKSSGATDEEVEKMRLFGEYVGIAFQIKDDLLDYQSDGLIGKPKGNDLKERKLTLPIIYALQKASIKERSKILSDIKRNNKNKQKVQQIIDFAIQKGGIDYSHQKMMEYKDKAIDLLKDFPDNEAKESLKDLVTYVVIRKK